MDNTIYSSEISSPDYIVDNIESAILVISEKGTLLSANPYAQSLLHIRPDFPYGSASVLKVVEARNDALHNVLNDAINKRGTIKKRTVPFWVNGDPERFLDVTVTRQYTDDKTTSAIIITLNDITYREDLTHKKQYSEYLFMSYISYMSLYIIVNSALTMLYSDSMHTYGNFVGLCVALVTVLPLYKRVPTDFLLAPIHIYKNRVLEAIVKGALLCAIFGGLMIGTKYLILMLAPEMLTRAQPFFYWDRLRPENVTVNTLLYPFTAFWQEYCMNVMGYDGMRTLLVGNHKKYKSIFMVALFFAATHYTYGFPMIVLTFCFVLFMNYIYRRTHNLWVCILLHIVLGQLLFTLQLQKIGF
ncbi:MAG: CPBP family intramembrane metalloprotease [Pseudobutyrivibrio sp.]|nr:CPBP family intramembrane metalloprotease [Pseudobutyrivibrio sp.]